TPGVQHTRDNQALVARSDVVVLSIRPEQFADVAIDVGDKLVISVMAGITAQQIAEHTGATKIVRSVPNAAAAIRHSFTPWHATSNVTAADRHIVQTMFDACGQGAEVPDEGHIDYCVAMTGSGAAFPALLADALVANAVAHGLPHEFAEQAAKGVLVDASQLLAQGQEGVADVVQTMI